MEKLLLEPLILAIDFDGTIVVAQSDFVPRTLMSNVKEVINWAYDRGCYVIIWTCRADEMLKPMIEFLNVNGIKYHSINENYPKIKFKPSKKIFADYYIDDRSFRIVWLEIKKEIERKFICKIADSIMALVSESK